MQEIPGASKDRSMIERSFGMAEPPIFIVGAGRSGTTLLRNMLNRHPRLAICGETGFSMLVYGRRGAFGDLQEPRNRRRLIKEYLATDRLRRMMEPNGLELATRLFADGISYPAFFACLLKCYAEFQGKKRCGQKDPDHALYSETLCNWYPGAKIIHLVRDPRDTVASLQRMPWATNSVVVNARLWLLNQTAALRSSHRPEYILVHYENLVSQPEQELTRICEHIGETYFPSMLVPQVDHALLGSWQKLSQTALTTTRIGSWHNELTEKEIALVEWTAGPQMEAFGYPCIAAPPSKPAIAKELAFARFDVFQHRLKRLPSVLYRLFAPTTLSKQDWMPRLAQRQEQAALRAGTLVNAAQPSQQHRITAAPSDSSLRRGA